MKILAEIYKVNKIFTLLSPMQAKIPGPTTRICCLTCGPIDVDTVDNILSAD